MKLIKDIFVFWLKKLKSIFKYLKVLFLAFSKNVLRQYSFPLPSVIFVNINNKCLNNCLGCFIKTDAPSREIEYADLVEIEKNLRYAFFLKPRIVLFGAEPSQHSRIVDIVDFFAKKKYKISFRTNGKLSLEKFKSIINAGYMDRVVISVYLDNFEHVLLLCNILNEYNLNHRKKIKYYLVIRVDLAVLAKKSLLEIVKVFDKCNARHIRFLHPVFDQEYYKQLDLSFIKKEIILLKKEKFATHILFSPNIKESDLENYYHANSEFINNKRCFFPWFYTTINWAGDVSPLVADCLKGKHIVLGNLKTERLVKIWNNPEYQKIRKLLIEPDPAILTCQRCIFKQYYGINTLFK